MNVAMTVGSHMLFINRYNLLLALSNCYILPCIWDHKQHKTGVIIFLAFFASFAYHLFESHKHHLTGFGSSPQLSRYLMFVDIWFALLLWCYMMNRAWQCNLHKRKKYWFLWTLCSVLFVSSEFGTFLFCLKPNVHRYWFTLLHCFWHLIAFETVYQILLDTKKERSLST